MSLNCPYKGPFAEAASIEGFIATRAASNEGFCACFGERAAPDGGLRTSFPASREGFFGTGPAPDGGLGEQVDIIGLDLLNGLQTLGDKPLMMHLANLAL